MPPTLVWAVKWLGSQLVASAIAVATLSAGQSMEMFLSSFLVELHTSTQKLQMAPL
jgi:hypothetical protein